MSPHERAAIGDRARAHVIGRFTLEAMKRQTLEVYDGLLGTSLAHNFSVAARVDTYAPKRACGLT
jgi:hypothetical protein